MTDILDYTAEDQYLNNNVILVTGAGGSIGSAVAQAYAAQGATVLLLGRSESRLAATYDAINVAGHPQAVMIPFDLEKAAIKDYDTITSAVQEQFGRLDGLVHCAAMLGALTPLSHYDPILWSRILQVNLNAPFLLTRACLDLMNAAESPSVIITLHELANQGKAYWGAYSIAQAGLKNLVDIFYDELEANTAIKINSLTPGPVRSRLRALAYPGEDPNILPSPESLLPYYLYLMDGKCPLRGEHIIAGLPG